MNIVLLFRHQITSQCQSVAEHDVTYMKVKIFLHFVYVQCDTQGVKYVCACAEQHQHVCTALYWYLNIDVVCDECSLQKKKRKIINEVNTLRNDKAD